MIPSIYCLITLLLIVPSRQLSIESGNVTLEQSYPYGKMWLSEKIEQVTAIVYFKTQFIQPPKVIVSIMKFDGMPNKNNMTSIYVSTFNITTSSFNIAFTKGDGYYVFSSMASWLAHGQKINQQGLLQIQLFTFEMPDGFNLGAMWTERKTTSRNHRVNISCFDNVPQMMIGLKKLDGRGGFQFGFSFLTIQAIAGVIDNCSVEAIFTKSHEYKAGTSLASGIAYSRTNNPNKTYLQNLGMQTGQSYMPHGYPDGNMWLNNLWSAQTSQIIKFSKCFVNPPEFKIFFSGVEIVSTYQKGITEYWNSFEIFLGNTLNNCGVMIYFSIWHYGRLKSAKYSWIAVGMINKKDKIQQQGSLII